MTTTFQTAATAHLPVDDAHAYPLLRGRLVRQGQWPRGQVL